MTSLQQKYLPLALRLFGIAFMALYLITSIFPDTWMWEPRQADYEEMIIGVYFVLGAFMFLAAKDPIKHLSLIWFAAISSIVHGLIMFGQALRDPMDSANMMGDIPVIIAVGLILVWLTPRAPKAD